MELNIPSAKSKRIVIVGGGFAGITLVAKLAKTGYQTVLVDKHNYHQFQPLLYQVATAALNPGDISFPFRKLYRGKKNVFFRMAVVERIDAGNKKLFTNAGELSYDYLVLATGSTTNFYGMENVERCSYPMKNTDEALSIRNRVLNHIERAILTRDGKEREALFNIVIVGGGAAGVEVAGAFAEMKKNVMPKDYPELRPGDINIYLVEGSDKILGSMSPGTSRDALKLLEKMGVIVMLNSPVKDYAGGEVRLGTGETIPTRNLIWTSGVKVELPEGLENSTRGRGGRVLTDDYMLIKGYEDIYAVGDMSIQQTDMYPNGHPQLARVAIEEAALVAKNLKRAEKGKAPVLFKYVEYPVLATVGRNRAFAEFKKFRLKGFLAWASWAVVHIATVLGVRNKFSIMWGWFWNYITYDMPTRIIVMPEKKEEGKKAGS